MKKQWFAAILITFSLIVGLTPAFALSEGEPAEATYTADDGTLAKGTLVDAFQNVCDTGTITLLNDVELSESVSLTDKTVTLLGAGHTVELEKSGNVSHNIQLSGNAVLYLGAEDRPSESVITLFRDNVFETRANVPLIALTGNAELYMYDGVTLGPAFSDNTGVSLYGNSRFYMYGGTITGCKTPAAVSGGVYVDQTAAFHMYDGVIENCEGYRGGGIGIASAAAIGGSPSGQPPLFHMHGGTIRNCTDTGDKGGGAVCINTGKVVQFIMDGGTITRCKSVGKTTATRGGGAVYINSTAAVSFLMNGGTISDCSSEESYSGYGGAIYINAQNSAAEVVINGTITNNRAVLGGGIFNYNGYISVGGTITGNVASNAGGGVFGNKGSVSVTSQAKLYGNAADTSGGADLYCQSNCSITLNANPSGYILPGCGHITDGWYWDEAPNRWNCENAETGTKYELPANGVVSGVALKAAHGANPQQSSLTITPADITIYTGGEGYTGVVDNAGQSTATANGLPEPGFYVTLPTELNALLGGSASAADLSDILTLKYQNGSATRTWELELYGTAAHSTDISGVETARYIYRILPGVDENGQNIPIRMQFTDDKTIVTSDEFTPSAGEQYKAYDMKIYSGDLVTDNIKAELVINGVTYCCAVDSDSGRLVVRGLTGGSSTSEIVSHEADVSDGITALAPNDVTYYINGSNVELKDTEGVRLLVDDVLDDGVLVEYIQNNMTEEVPAGDYTYEQQYLDLVDTQNGNAYLTLGKNQKMTVYWPVPSDMDTGKDYYIVHFEALDRNYDNMDEELQTAPPTTVEGTSLVTVNGRQHIKFETGSFSPFVLVYEKTTGGGGTHYSYTLRYDTNGGEVIQSESKSYSWTKQYEDLPTPIREGYTFDGWYLDSKLTDPVEDDVKVNRSTVIIYAAWSRDKTDPDNNGVSDWLNTKDHNAYLSGYPDGTFGPDKNMTRAEVAQMFYALLKDKNVTVTTSFSDVPADAWYAKAVNTLASLGMLGGYPDGTFRPDAPITRAEFAAIALAFAYDPADASCAYTDVSAGAWYYTYVAQATTYGWIGGYPDGTFRPNNSITRAEVCVIVNNMLGRGADERYVDRNGDELVSFFDLNDDHWAYYTIMEATNTHDHTKDGSEEVWKTIP